MSDETERDGSEPGSVTVRMASEGVSDPDLLEQVYRLETEKQRARLEAQRDRSFAQILVEKLVSSLEPEDLVPLIKLVAKAVTQYRTEPESESSRPGTPPETSSGTVPSPAKQRLDDIET